MGGGRGVGRFDSGGDIGCPVDIGPWSSAELAGDIGHPVDSGPWLLVGGFGWGLQLPKGHQSRGVADGSGVIWTGFGFGWGQQSPRGWRFPDVVGGC